jgi:gas vesicle protein
MSDKNSGSGFGIGLILGIAAGAALGFLFAPRSGKETREMVKDKAVDVSETVKDLTADRRKVYTETWKKRRGQPKVSESYFES